jgi:hypothetical protein
MAPTKPLRKVAPAPMSKSEAAARAQAKEMKTQQANDKAYEAARTTGYKNGGMVKCSKSATKRSWG